MSTTSAPPVADRREHIISTAALLFRRRGYAGTSIQDIADVVGLTKGSLYHHISSKEDLLEAIIEDVHLGWLEVMRETQDLELDPARRLHHLIYRHVEVIGDNFERGRGYYTDYRFLPEERAERLLAQRAVYEEYILRLFRLGVERGQFRPDLHPELTKHALLSMLNSVFIWYEPGTSPSFESVAEHHADLFVAGLTSAS